MIGLWGGTFDPVHLGHLISAVELKSYLQCDEMRLVPCAKPPHRSGVSISDRHRLAMLHLAVKDFPQLVLEECEFHRPNISYSIDTLQIISNNTADNNHSLCWCIGSDVFQQLPRWHRWRELLNYAHLIVVNRNATKSIHNPILQPLIQQFSVNDINQLHVHKNGLIHFCQLTPMDISATKIRHHFKKYNYHLTSNVRQYALTHHLYMESP